MRKNSKEKGITLIALVVTIIILLILAAIGLRGIDTLVFKAKDATNRWKAAEEDEVNELDKIASIIDGNPEDPMPQTPDIPGIPDVSPDIDGLPETKPYTYFPPDYIPIYTVEQYKDIASEKSSYVINDLSGTYVGTYTMATNATYVFMNDIDFASAGNVPTIKNFNGTLEGNGCTISNISIDTTDLAEDYIRISGGDAKWPRPAGMFECVTDATIRNYAVVNANIKSKESAAAITAQCNNATITNCYVKDSTIDGMNSAGIVGYIGPRGVIISKCKTISTNMPGTSATAGIASTSYGDITINDCNVTKSSTTNSMKLNSGILYYTANDKTTTINNCNVQDIELKDNHSAGILAVANGNVTIDKCNTKKLSGSGALLLGYVGNNGESVSVTNCSSQSSEMTKSDGMIREIYLKGSSYETSVNVENCSMKDIKATGTTYSASFGLIGECQNVKDLKISKCSAVGIEFTNGDSIAGILGHVYSNLKNLEVSDCHVDNIKINTAKNAAGIVAAFQGENITVTECSSNNLTVESIRSMTGGIVAMSENKPLTVKNCTVANFDASKGEASELQKVGGAIGFSGTGNNNALIENVKVYNSKLGTGVGIVNQLAIGGICGMSTAKEINNCYVKDVEINGKNCEAVGGLIGISQVEMSMTKCAVNNCKVVCNESGKESKQVGGILGQEYTRATIKDAIVNNFSTEFDTTSGKCEFIGGVVGLGGAYGGSITIDNVNVNHSKLKSGGRTGGMIGYSPNANVANSKVYETWLYMHCNDNNMRAVGGIVGYASTSNIDNATVDHVGIESHVRVGGIVGFGDNINISNSKVDMTGIKVTATARSTYAGGIAAYAPFNCKIESCSLYGTEIRLTGDGQEASLGGIVGHGNNSSNSNSLITKCNLDSCKFEGTSGVGGIAGVAVPNIIDCHTKNTYVEGTIGNIGGILGYGGATSTINSTTGEETKNRKAVNITNCSIVDGFLSGPNTGSIIGKNSHMASTPDVTEDVIEGCTYQFKETE